MLSERFAAHPLVPREQWHPRPSADDREAWERIPPDVSRRILRDARARRESPWPVLGATSYLEYARVGNRSRFQSLYFERRWMFALFVIAECIEDRGAWLDRIAEGTWLLCEESSWCVPAHIAAQKAGAGLPDIAEPIVDLFAAETGAALAWASYLVGSRLDGVSPLLVPRISREVHARIVTPFLAREDFWWMGFDASLGRPNNWNPWVNSNVLAAACLLEDDPGRREAVVGKCMRSLDRFLDPYPPDGGCDEGPSYWSRAAASVFDCLETLESVSAGRIAPWDDPLVAEMGRYILRVWISGNRYVNFADAPARVDPPAGIVYSFGKKTGDRALAAMGASLDAWEWEGAADELVSPERLLREIFLAEEMKSARRGAPCAGLFPRDTWFKDIEVLVSRDAAGSDAGLFLAAKAGHNGESHNHNDVGTFIVSCDGRPLVVDAGVGEYTRSTFDPRERYKLWTMQSAFHTLLPAFDGTMQSPGKEYAAREVSYEADDASASLRLDLAGAYPAEAGVSRWQRRIEHRRGAGVFVEDDYLLARPVGEIVLCLLTPCRARVAGKGRVRLGRAPLPGGTTARGTLEAALPEDAAVSMQCETLRLDDPRLCSSWGDRLTRVVLRLRRPPRAGKLLFTFRGRA